MIEKMQNLITLLSQDPCDLGKVQSYLTELNSQPNQIDELTQILASPEVFERLRQKADILLFQIFLDFDLPLPDSYDATGFSDDLLALLNTRGSWQKEIQTGETAISFNRTHQLVRQVLDYLHEESVQPIEGLLAIGETGHGKSTLCNFMLGVDYQYDDDTGVVKSSGCQVEERAHIGHGTRSETFLPQALLLSDLSVQWIDFAGIKDTRGTTHGICAAMSVKTLTEKIETIRGLLLVCAAYAIESDARIGSGYREVAIQIGRIIETDESLSRHVILTITKASSRTTRESIKKRLDVLWEAELKNLNDHGSQDPQYQDHLALKRVTKIFRENILQIVIAEVTNPNARTALKTAIKALPESKPYQDFNFSTYHHLVERYQSKFEFLTSKSLALSENIIEQTKILEESSLALEKLHEKKRILEGASTIDNRIAENEKCLEDLGKNREVLDDSLRKLVAQRAILLEQRSQVYKRLDLMGNHPQALLNARFLELYQDLIVKNQQAYNVCRERDEQTLNQIYGCQRRSQKLREERVDILAIQASAGTNIDDDLSKVNAVKMAAATSLETSQRQLRVNEEFFKKLDYMSAELGFEKNSPSSSGLFGYQSRASTSSNPARLKQGF